MKYNHKKRADNSQPTLPTCCLLKLYYVKFEFE